MPLVTDFPLPLTAEEIRADWLSEALGVRFPRAFATSV